jgi:tetratricopeptide (TPR) repeat protein
MSYLHKEKVFFYFNKNIFFLKKTSEKLINRPYLISKIENVFKNQRGLKIVALIGVGGVGKTTLAHQYAMTQKNSFIWEINASCEESILTSFENLLHFMAVKNQDNIFMKNILFLNNKKLRKDSILYLIKNILKSKKEWILIYDNFEDISKLKDYFPNNIEEWGNGKVIITSQNKNIINIIDLKNIIELGEISKEEKIKIFLNINNNNTKKDLLYFVQKLPPFPLDISIASYYIKITGISHKRYLLYLNSYDKDFINMQKKIASEIGFYDKIRYDIIKLSLEKIIEENKKFLDLIFFISFLSPDNIPMIVLEHNTSPIVIDSFIYNLKRYSFLTKENNIINSNIKTISLHKSIQEMIYKYINQNITLVNIKKIINIMLLSLEKISNEAIENNNYKLIKILIEHFEQILNRNTSLLNESEINYLKLNLGILYFYDKNYSKSKNLLENVKYINDKRKLAKKLICLGDIYRQLGYYEKSENLLKKGVQIYKNNYFKEKDKNLPWSLAYLGNFYRSIGNYGMARNVLEESLFIYKEKYHLNKRNVAQVMTLLQYVYTDLGDYEKAKDLLKNSLDIYKEVDCKNYVIIGWILSLLGNIYQKQNNDSRAINFLEEGLYIYKKLIPSDHFSIAWIYGYLGNVYIKIREFEKANNFLSKALSIYKKNCRKDHPKVAWIIALYGNFYEAQGNNRKAKELLEKSFNIYQKNFSQYHINVAWVLLCLGRVYTKLEDYKNAKYFLEKSLLVYRKNLLHNHENVIILKKLLKINNSRLKEASGYVACSKMKCHTVKGVLVD